MMFKDNENMCGELSNLKVACIGGIFEIWKQQPFCTEFKLLEGNPVESVSWKGVDIGFLLVEPDKEADIYNLIKAVEAAKEACIALLIPIVVSAVTVEAPIALLTINPERYTDKSELYKNIYYVIKSINDVVCIPELVNLDVADLAGVCQDKKNLIFAMGEASGENSCMTAAEKAINKIDKQKGNAKGKVRDVLLNVTGSEDNLSMYEIQEVSGAVYDWLDDEQATIIWGATIDDSLRDRIRVSILLGE